MNRNFTLNRHKTEILSAFIRWLLLVITCIIFLYPPIANELNYQADQYIYLFIFGIVYMGSTQIILHYCKEETRLYEWGTKSGIIFDVIAVFWLLLITGGHESVFFPIFYLVPIHAALYWRLKGAIYTAIIITALYTILLFALNYEFTFVGIYKLIIELFLLFLIAVYGGVLATKERSYYLEKEQFQQEAITDFLTGAYNHRYFQEILKNCVNRGKPFFLIFADLDHFKHINDKYGHLYGDKVISSVANLLKQQLPKNLGEVFRYGGEEFAIIIFDHSMSNVERYIEDVIDALEIINREEKQIEVTLSFGITLFELGESRNQIIHRVDQLLYKAKTTGRNKAIYSRKFDHSQDYQIIYEGSTKKAVKV